MTTPQQSQAQARAYKNLSLAEIKDYYTFLLDGGTADDFFFRSINQETETPITK